MSVVSTRAVVVGILAVSLLFARRAVGQSTDSTSSKPVDHSTMTPAQHAAMHGNSASKVDSAFAALQERGKVAMGVDQYASAHQFDVLPDGGRIALQMKEADSLAVAQIRAHLKLIQHAFQAGDFSTPEFVHMRAMPGSDVMSKKKSLISYTYADLPRGGEVRISTSDPESLIAIRQFMDAQRGDHRGQGHRTTPTK